MATQQPSSRNKWIDNIFDFFLGTPKRVKGTLLFIVIILFITHIDATLAQMRTVINKIMIFVSGIIHAYLGLFVLVVIIVVISRNVFPKKPKK